MHIGKNSKKTHLEKFNNMWMSNKSQNCNFTLNHMFFSLTFWFINNLESKIRFGFSTPAFSNDGKITIANDISNDVF